MQQRPKLQFPKKFLWGASTSAHQVEGGQHNQWSVWELENARSLAARAEYQLNDLDGWAKIGPEAKDPANYISGRSAEHYTRYEEDFDLLTQLGLDAFRFSVEWSRIEPTEGAWDAAQIEHYKKYVKALKRRGIEPMVTLFHFTLPEWFAQMGGFEKRANVKYFVRFAEKILSELGTDIRYVITINEPEVYVIESYYRAEWPPQRLGFWRSFRVLRNLIYAHNKTAKMIHRLNRRYRVSIAKNSSYVYAGDSAVLSRISARVLQYIKDDFILTRVRRTCDFIGVNYYFCDRVYGYRVHNPDNRLSDLGWDMHPENLEFVLERLHRKYKLPIIVTENGLADGGDKDRKWWIGKTMLALSNALEQGVKLEGYFHWSLLDNFEWAHGMWPNFGLVEVDYKTMKRTIRPSALWWSGLLKKIKKGSQ
jgi:beta-glucosidase